MLDSRQPDGWPTPPQEMTFSTLKAMEACARQWALQNADYPAVWRHKGYPPRLVMAALLGTIAHSVVETLSREFVAAGCRDVHDEEAIHAMRKLGGYTNVIGRAIDVVVASWRENPRASRVIEAAERALRDKLPEIRALVQALLSQVGFGSASGPRAGRAERPKRGALTQGAFSELVLRAPRIQWKGKVDLLVIDDAGCEIVEFKTGRSNPNHPEQLRTYAALWWMDQERNPASRPAAKLTVVYPSGKEVVTPPGVEDLEVLANEMLKRGQSAVQSVNSIPPLAKPDPDVCRYCTVRQLCAEYWVTGRPPMAVATAQAAEFVDIQAVVEGRHGASSWDATVEVGTRFEPNAKVVIRVRVPGLQLERGQRVRILDAWNSQDAEAPEAARVVTLTASSEVYMLS